jgi:hypothetical protein
MIAAFCRSGAAARKLRTGSRVQSPSKFFEGDFFMKIGDSISSYYGIGSLFGQQNQAKNKQGSGDFDTGATRSGTGPKPAYTPPSISKAMWDMQPAGDTTIAEESEADLAAKARHDQLISGFSESTNMTLAEMIRKRILDQLGLDENSLKAMPPEERAAVEKQIADAIKRELTGIDGGDDNSATSDLPQTASNTDAQTA